MITFIKMKYKEWKLKLAFYTVIEKVLGEQKDFIKLISDMYTALKDTPTEELQNKLITTLAELIHNDNRQNKDE